MKPMRMLVLLAVFWAAGSLLLAAESPPASAPKPAAAEKAKEPAKEDKPGEAERKASIADQAEAALKAAAEADVGSAREPAKDAKDAKDAAEDDTQAPPSGSTAKGPSPQRFTPTEQVRADFDVSFPIDI